MAEWNETKLEQELENLMEDMPVQEDLEKKIQRSISKRIKRTAAITSLAVLLAAATLFLCISPLMNLMFWNPAAPAEGEQQLAFSVLRDYWEVTEPYVDLLSLEVTKNGFGCYDLALQVVNHREPMAVGKLNLWMELNRGKYENRQDPEGYFTHHMDRFTNGVGEEKKGELIESLQELPASALVYLSVADAKARDIEDLRRETLRLYWIQVYQPNVQFQGGLSLLLSGAYTQEDVRQNLDATQLLQVYCANLENLLEHREIWEQLMLTDGNYIYGAESGVLQETYADAKKLTSLTCKNYCVSGTRDEVIEYLRRTEVTSVWVDEVRLSKWN